MPFGLYLHLPFCPTRCYYCDFCAYPLTPKVLGRVDAYLAALEKELDLARCLLPPQMATSIYLGGGTPTCLTERQLERVLVVVGRWPRANGAEITIEANPGTLNRVKVHLLRSWGVNRLSLGVQSWHDPDLERMGRGHSAAASRVAFALAREAGFDNISLDLMYGLPEQTLADWRDNLAETVALRPEHISIYGLTLTGATPWARAARRGALTLPTEDQLLAMRRETNEFLRQAGYHHYEIANYALPGFVAQHNLNYWLAGDYLGLGAGASSHLGSKRWSNLRPLSTYGAAVAQGRLPLAAQEQLSEAEEMAEFVFLGLRLRAGVDPVAFKRRFKRDLTGVYSTALEQLLAQGLVRWYRGNLSLTSRGLPLANYVMSEFINYLPQ